MRNGSNRELQVLYESGFLIRGTKNYKNEIFNESDRIIKFEHFQ